nr:contact-dependent growth inhibition system immunity protein [uncultured Methanoregula sp.]
MYPGTWAKSFADLDQTKGHASLPPKQGEELPLPQWYRSVYHTPLAELTDWDLARACQQRIHIEEIVPIVLERLRVDPLVGEMFDGQLLVSLRSLGATYWQAHPKDTETVKMIVKKSWSDLPEDVRTDAQEILQAAG